MDLSVTLGSLRLRNPILLASGTYGYAREMAHAIDYATIGGLVPKTVTAAARVGNHPPRTVETAAGLLNAIGLDNDGIDYFIHAHLPYLVTLPTAVIANVAGKSPDEFVSLAEKIAGTQGLAGLELNLSCPNVAGGLDFATDPKTAESVVARVRQVYRGPLIAKLTPNVTSIGVIAQAVEAGGADIVSVANTLLGLAIDWRQRRPVLGNGLGGLSGPAIKPVILRMVWQVRRAIKLPIIGIGGIQSLDDVMEFLLAGASAVQLGTVNFYDPLAGSRLAEALPTALATLNAKSIAEIVGTLQF